MGKETETWKIYIQGSVQGVGFRPFIYRIAHYNHINGFVKNRGGHVLIVAQGTRENLKHFWKDIIQKKPPLARYTGLIRESWHDAPDFTTFIIKPSEKTQSLEQSYIPPDVAICDDCIKDMLIGDRDGRKHYPFTSCVNCGPRYTIIHQIPYDRPNTEMKYFPFCKTCQQEYENPLDRRFHAQTTCCSHCGPKYTVYQRNGEIVQLEEHKIPQFIMKVLSEGALVAIKGIGGTHIAADAYNDEPILRLRRSKGDRKRKPFAVMSANIEEIERFAYLTEKAKKLLTSIRRPIVLLPKKNPFPLSQYVAPYLHNVGVMLPYAGLHVLMFQHPNPPTMIMTSANFSHQPILIHNEKILKHLNFVDYFVLHNRNIYQRCDDSVIKTFTTGEQLFIRRSRGYVPEPITLPINPHHNRKDTLKIVGLGAELHNTLSLGLGNRVYPSQYIGDLKYHEAFDFYQHTLNHLLSLFNVRPESLNAIITDLHPLYISTQFGEELAKKYDLPYISIQHHFAHACALLADTEWTDEAIILAADGVGYGLDKTIWGSEVLHITEGEIQRLTHLRYVPMPGGDLATKYPARMLLSYLVQLGWSESEILEWFNAHLPNTVLPNGLNEVSIVIKQIKKKVNTPLTSSMGRLLDTLAILFNLTHKATYEGEPAIILESYALTNHNRSLPKMMKNINPIELEFHNNTIDPTPLLEYLLERINNDLTPTKKIQLAFLTQYSIAHAFAQYLTTYARENNIHAIGFSGGVAYNEIFTHVLQTHAEKNGLTFLRHKKVPPGDGGISIGQIFAHYHLNS